MGVRHTSRMLIRRFTCFTLVALALSSACGGGGSANDPGTGGSGGGSAATGGSSNGGELPFEDPGADAPALELPAAVTDAVNAIAGAPTLTDAIAATQAALAQGGVSTVDGSTVLTPGSAPAATAYVPSLFIADMALEAWKRKDVATLTATQLGQMFADFGMPVPDGKTSGQVVLEALAAWTNAALAKPDEPAAFAILFIAASNQLQSPRANLSLTTQDPDLVRFSLLDLELLSAAIDRVSTSDPKPVAGPGSCSVLTDTYGQWEGTIKTGTGAASDFLLDHFLEHVGGKATSAAIGGALSVIKLATKVWKMAQVVRYGTMLLTLDTASPTKKPRPSAAKKFGALTATAGVDAKSYDEFQKWNSAQGQSTLNEINTCLDYLGMPTKTDITDVAKDASNWRVSWEITKGGGTEVLFKEGQDFKILSRLENPLSAASATEAKNTVEFEILPQLADIDQGKERTRHAVFSAQLRRGSSPGLDTLWGAGAGGGQIGAASTFAGVLGVAASMAEISGNWALEVASPKRFVTQALIEVEPKGWVGTITITESGEGKKRFDSGTIPIDGVWSATTAKFRYETRMTLGGTQAVSGDPFNSDAVGHAAAHCMIDVDDSSGGSNCGEGCPTAIPPGPLSRLRTHTVGNWQVSEDLGGQASVLLLAYPESIFGQVKDQLPPEIQAKIGTWELMIIPLSCGDHSALSATEQVNVQLISPNYITKTTNSVEQVPVTQFWTGPYPPNGDFQLVISGKLDESKSQQQIQASFPLSRTSTLTGFDDPIKSVGSIDVNLRLVN